MEYRKVIARMIVAAWYPVVFYKLSLGVADKLSDVIDYIHNDLGVHREEKEEKIVSFVNENKDESYSE